LPVRVLNVIGSLEVGGTETYLSRVTPLLRERGIDVELCLLEHRGPLIEVFEAEQIPVHDARMRWRSARALLMAAGRVSRMLRSGQFDAVHSYLFVADLVGTIAGQLAGTKRVIVSRRSLHQGRHRPVSYLHWLELGSNALADELIANSTAVLRDVERTERFLPRRRGVIHNGIDVAAYPKASPGAGAGSLELVAVGNLIGYKGHRFLVEALQHLQRTGTDAKLTIVGEGPEREALSRLADGLGVGDRLSLVGRQANPRPYLQAADIFVLPSEQEGFSNALLEGMASGLPVVATRVGGNAEALGDGGGRLVAPQDAEALARAIGELAKDRGGLRSLGDRNRARAEAEFSIKTSADKLAAWYLRGGKEAP
jgi:glycosyltransferase involved in cell wall biosynthesis